MGIAFLLISILGAAVFFTGGDTPVGIIFAGLVLVYICEIVARFTGSKSAERGIALFQVLTGIWLMYMTFAATFTFALGQHWWL